MKYALIFAIAFLSALPVIADDNVTIIRNPDAEVRHLPGNTTIVTNGGGGPSGVYIEGDDDIWRTMVLGPRTRIYAPNYGTVNSTCPPTLSIHDRNKCVRDMMKAQEKIRKKYND